MNYVRWYDKDQYLSPIMNILEKLPIDIQNSIAQDLVQIIMSSYDTQNNDQKIAYLNQNTKPTYKRWYDKNLDLLSSIEVLKITDEQTKKEICESVLDFLFQILIQEKAIND